MVPFDLAQGRMPRHEQFYLIRSPETARLNNRKPTRLSIKDVFVFLFLTELPKRRKSVTKKGGL
jgi:hypothetical protein